MRDENMTDGVLDGVSRFRILCLLSIAAERVAMLPDATSRSAAIGVCGHVKELRCRICSNFLRLLYMELFNVAAS